MSNIDSAIAFAATAHAGQTRKWSRLPYIVHPIHVLQILLDNATDEVTEEMMMAAVLHDVVEDTIVTHAQIERRFGVHVAALVSELTDEFTKDKYQSLNRAMRKDMERERLSRISKQGQSIKYADLISNTMDIVAKEPGFAHSYLREKAALMDVMQGGDPGLFQKAWNVMVAGQQALVQLRLGEKV